ncbi:MAG: RNA polymerase sigma factor [Saprospiraceae bacterium]|nr:RNA polymerase sigma factor [Saprospiraceae bacterium]
MSEQFTTEFEHIRPQLRAYILRMTASVADTEDIVQDTWIKASQNIGAFQGHSSLKTWLFAIASNLAKDQLRRKKRWTEDCTDICRQEALGNRAFFEEAMHIRQHSPQGHFEIKEHIAFCFTCIAKSLPLEQQLALLLKEVYGFKIKEIAEIMATSEAMTKYHLHTGRSKMIDIFERRCALINKEGVCHQCTELNGIFNPKQNAQVELVKIDMAREAGNKDKEALFDLRMQIVQHIDPFDSDAAALQLHHLEHNRTVMEAYLRNNPSAPEETV